MQHSTFLDKQVLVTGGAGFIGSNLAIRLRDLGARVTVADAMVPAHGGNRLHLESLGPAVAVLQEPLERMSDDLAACVAAADTIFHLAVQGCHWDSMEEPLKDLHYNCSATLALLEACRRHNPRATLVFASTRQVYGSPRALPVDEGHPLQPVDVNGIHKIAAEHYHLLYHRVHRLPVTIARLTNTYGPRMRIRDARQTFLGLWIRQALEGQPFDVWDGRQRRDFNYVDDVVDALLKMATHPQAIGKVYNLGGDRVYSLRQAAETLTELTGTLHVIRAFPADRKAIDIGDYHASYEAIRSQLGWSPSTTFREGLAAALAYFRAHAHLFQP